MNSKFSTTNPLPPRLGDQGHKRQDSSPLCLVGKGCCSLEGTHPRSPEACLHSDVMFTASRDSSVTLLVRAPVDLGGAGGVVVGGVWDHVAKCPSLEAGGLFHHGAALTVPVSRGWRAKARALSCPAQHRRPQQDTLRAASSHTEHRI